MKTGMKITKIDWLAMVLLFLGLLLVTATPELFMRVNTTIDEAGTLASAAFLSGRNWHTGIVSIGGHYYKYGLALLWTLPFLLIDDSLRVLRTIGFIDAVCLSTTPAIAYYISRRFLRVEKRGHAAVLAFVSTIIPDVLFHAVYLRGDNILTVMNWVCVLFLLCALHARTRAGKILYSILLSLSSVYAFACHSRGVVLVIATAMTVIIVGLFMKKRCVHLPSYLVSLAIFLVIDRKLQLYFLREIWQGKQAHATGIHPESFQLLFSVRGIQNLLQTVVGWLYAAMVPTGGLFCVAVIACILVGFHMIGKTGKVSCSECTLAVFSALSYVGSLALGLLFFLPEVSKIYDLTECIRLDRITFDRYSCSTFGILCFAGLYILAFRKDIFGTWAKILSLVGGIAVFVLFAQRIAPWFSDGHTFLKRYMAALCLFLPVRDTTDSTIAAYGFSHGLIMVGIPALLLLVLSLILLHNRHLYLFGILFFCVSMPVYGFCLRYLLIEPENVQADKMENVLRQVEEFGDLYETYPLVYASGNNSLKAYQVRLMNYHMIGPELQTPENLNNVLYIVHKLPGRKMASEGVFFTIDGGRYGEEGRDALLVKGRKLKRELEARGYTLTRYRGPTRRN